jgi:phage-related protein
MALVAGSVALEMKALNDNVLKGIDATISKLTNLENSVDKTSKKAESGFFSMGGIANVALGNLAGNAIGGAISGLKSLGENAITQADNYEKGFLKYKTLLGSSEEATKRIAELQSFAAKTPFETEEIQKADVILQSFGIRSEKMLNTIGNASAISGSSIGDLGLIMGQLKGSNGLDNIRQLVERGIVSFDELKQKGIEFNKDGSVKNSVEETFNAINGIIETKFAGGMDNLSNTFSGKWSTLMDTINIGLQQFATNSGLLDFAKQSVDWLITAFGSLANVANLLISGDFTGGIFGLGKDDPIIGFLFILRDSIMSLTTNGLNPFNQFLEYLQTVILPAVMPLVNQLADLFITKVGPLVSSAIALVIPIVQQLMDAFNFALPYIVQLAQYFISAISPLFDRVRNEILPLILPAIEAVVWAFKAIVPFVLPVLQFFVDILAANIGFAIDIFKGLLKGITGVFQLLQGVFTLNGGLIKQAFENIFGGIGDIAIGAIRRAMNGVISALNAGIRTVNGFIGNIPDIPGVGGIPRIPTIPSFAKGVSNFSGGLAYVHQGELLANLPRGTDVLTATQTQGVLENGSGKEINATFILQGLFHDEHTITEGVRKAARILKEELGISDLELKLQNL